MNFFKIFSEPLSWIMGFFYNIFENIPFNYTITLVVFTIVIKSLLFPLSIKQQKSTAKMAAFQPKIKAIQKKYGTNKQKIQEETVKLYTEEGYSPLSGCLPMLIQFPILFGLIYLIYEPLTYILNFSKDIISKAIPIAEQILGSSLATDYTAEISIINAFKMDPTAFSTLGSEFVDKISKIDLNLFGINLGQIPVLDFTSFAAITLMIIPFLSGLSSLLVSYISMKSNARATGNEIQGFTKGMILVMPVFSLIISFQFPIGVSFYWILSNLLMIIQTLVLNKIWNPKKLAEDAKIQLELNKKNKKSQSKQLQDVINIDTIEEKEKKFTQKELNKKRLAEARRLDAEKYGEDYLEVNDKDLK